MLKRILILVLILVGIIAVQPGIGQDSADAKQPPSKRQIIGRINQLKNSDSLDSAIDLVDSLLLKEPDLVEATSIKGELLLAAGDTATAEAMLNEALTKTPSSSAILLALSRIDMSRREYKSARDKIDHLINLKPGNHRAHIAKGRLYQSLGKPDSAAACYKSAVELLLKRKRMMP
jgi:tetratricopeptide (TPR) repeat protein